MRTRLLVSIFMGIFLAFSGQVIANAVPVLNDGLIPAGGPYANTYNYYYAVQNTSPTNSTPASDPKTYYWRGVKGYFYWKSDGGLPDGAHSGTHLIAAMSMKQPDNATWVQAGLWRKHNGAPQEYIEFLYQPGVAPTENWGPYPADPVAQYVKVKWTGTFDPANGKPVWSGEIAGLLEDDFDLANALAAPVVQNESVGYGYGAGWDPTPATVYFGTNAAGWNGAAYELNILNHGSTWENWDTALSYQSTTAHEYQPIVHYSQGNPYYYFGGWAP